VGPTGKVVGVDLCPEMVEKARRNALLLGLQTTLHLSRPPPALASPMLHEGEPGWAIPTHRRKLARPEPLA
jgi:hypothetical protein